MMKYLSVPFGYDFSSVDTRSLYNKMQNIFQLFKNCSRIAGLWPQKSVSIFMMSLIDFSLNERFHLKMIKQANLHGAKVFLMENSSIIIENEYLFKVTFMEFYSEDTYMH